MRFTLRDYQVEATEQLRRVIRRGARSVVLVSPTGSGKTTIAASMIESAAAKDKRVLFLAHRKELIDQCSARLDEIGVDHGIIKADHPRRKPWLSVHVCSVPTLVRRDTLPPADLIFIDECHRARGASYEKILERYPKAVCIGLTATPIRTDGRGLGKLFQGIVECPPVSVLTELGYLVPVRIFAPARPDLAGVHTQAGDYRSDELAKVMDRATITGDIVSHWLKHAGGRQTVAFGVSIAHSQHIFEEFRQAGTAAEHLDATTRDSEREAILARLASGETKVVCSVGVLTEGWDCPATSCAILARPTQSLGLYLQMAGRILRPHSGKADALILDHAGCVFAHGFVDDPRTWSLDDSAAARRPSKDTVASVRMCKLCWMAFRSSQTKCPSCGWLWEGQLGQVKTEEGELEEITDRKRYTIRKLSSDPEIARLQQEAQEKGYKPGWVWHRIQDLRRAAADPEFAVG